MPEFWLDFLAATPPSPKWPFVPSECVELAITLVGGGYFPYRVVNFAVADAATHLAGGRLIILFVLRRRNRLSVCPPGIFSESVEIRGKWGIT